MLILGFILFMGLSVPAYFSGVELTFEPDWLADMITTVGSTGMAVAATSA